MKPEEAITVLKLINDLMPEDYNLTDKQALAVASLSEEL